MITPLLVALLGFGFPERPRIVKDQPGNARRLEAEKRWSEAAQVWSAVAAANPTDPYAPLNAGNDYYQAKEYRVAIAMFQAADSLGVSYKWDMPYTIACCYALAGNRAEALNWLEKSMRLGYRDLPQVQTDKDLDSLHGDKRFVELAATADVAHMDRAQGYRYDLWLANRELRRLHYSLYGRHTEKEFDAFVARFEHDIPKLSDAQIAVRFKELYAMAGDGHTHLTIPAESGKAKQGLPVSFFTFEDGTYIIGADAAHQNLLGNQVVKVEGRPIKAVLEALVPICSYENAMWILARSPDHLRIPALLNGLGLTASAHQTTFTLRTPEGVESDVTLTGDADRNAEGWSLLRNRSKNPTPLTYKHRDKNYWFEFLPDGKTVFVQYNAVMDAPDESVAKFSERLFAFIASHDVDRLILDMRWNGGGNNFLNKPLLEGLIKCKLNVPGKLFVITSRFTFSAAMCGATQIERYTHAIFAGEPTGSCPNFIGESVPVRLPYSGITGTVSDLYWQNSVAGDHRTWISPKIYAPLHFADYAQNHDPVLDAITGYQLSR